MMQNSIKIAKKYFYEKNYNEAFCIFSKLNEYYGAGLCAFLLQEEKTAKIFWKKNKNCFASDFGLCALEYVHSITKTVPSFFQTRAFLEVYMNLLLENKLTEWAQNFMNCYDIFYQGNPESYKFLGRALFSNGYFDLAITFLKKSLNIFWSDPEAFLILAQSYYMKGDITQSKSCINRTLSLAPEYYPAKLFLNILNKEILQ